MKIRNYIDYIKSQTPISIKDNENILIMSFNIRCISKIDKGNNFYKVRMPLIKKVIEDANPDIIGFQEVKVKQFKYLLKILKEYDYEYKKRDLKKDGEANPIFFKKNRFTCFNKNTFWLSESFHIMSNSFNGSCNRICSYVGLKDNKSNKEFYVFNTHLDHKNEEARIKGIKLIKDIIKEMKVIDLPHLIMGDMNDFYNSHTINELFKDYIDASSFNHLENQITFQDYGRNKEKIDYIALAKDINQLDYKVITTTFNNIYPSDHYPIEVIIKL